MERTSIYWGIRGKMEEARANLLQYEKEDLVHLLINTRYNNFISSRSDYGDKDRPQDPTIVNGLAHGKRVPYIGWSWRNIDFSRKEIPIGDCQEFIGFMANNKWDYEERCLTEEEANTVIKIIESAMRADEEGGSAEKIENNAMRELEKLWGYLQGLKIKKD